MLLINPLRFAAVAIHYNANIPTIVIIHTATFLLSYRTCTFTPIILK
jgi:hypothetical protein